MLETHLDAPPVRDVGDSPGPPVVAKLANWDHKASVRVKPRRLLMADEEADGKVFFSPELVPVAHHPLVRRLGPEAVRESQVQHLYRYLDFTTQLELEVINVVAKRIALDQVGFALPDVLRADAFKLCTDEAHHAYFSDDLQRQVAEATRIAPLRNGAPPFLIALRAIQQDLPAELATLSEITFSVVSETLISSILCRIPKDERVITAVREIVADHAEDEGRHSAFFSQFFGVLWRALEDRERALLGPLLPRFILAFFQPDTAAIGRSLERLGLSPAEAAEVVAQTYPPARLPVEAREAAKVTIRLFQHNEVLDDSRIGDAFRALDLHPDSGGAGRKGKRERNGRGR